MQVLYKETHKFT